MTDAVGPEAPLLDRLAAALARAETAASALRADRDRAAARAAAALDRRRPGGGRARRAARGPRLMGQVHVAIGGRTYSLACADGEEAHLRALGDHLAAKADELTAAIGTMSEPRLLLMAGLQIADDLFAARAAPGGGDHAQLEAVLARVEALAAALEG